jgi:hypothetical protein
MNIKHDKKCFEHIKTISGGSVAESVELSNYICDGQTTRFFVKNVS